MDSVTGISFEDGDTVKLTIDSDKSAFIKLPNGSFLETALGVIDTVCDWGTGNVIYYTPKNCDSIDFSLSEMRGQIVYSGVSSFGANSCPNLVGVNAYNSAIFNAISSTNLLYLDAPIAVELNASGSSVLASNIGNVLRLAYIRNISDCAFDFSGGNNGLQGDVDAYLQSAFDGLTYSTVYSLLVTTNGGTILIDTV